MLVFRGEGCQEDETCGVRGLMHHLRVALADRGGACKWLQPQAFQQRLFSIFVVLSMSSTIKRCADAY
jgi:hypothetical protein